MKENSLLSILRNTGVHKFAFGPGFGKDVPLEWFESGLIHWISIFEEKWLNIPIDLNFCSNINHTIPGSRQYCFPGTPGSEDHDIQSLQILNILSK